MKLKHLYSLSILGVVLSSFGFGWIVLSEIAQLPLSELSAVGLGSLASGLVILIKTLSTIRKIDLVIE